MTNNNLSISDLKYLKVAKSGWVSIIDLSGFIKNSKVPRDGLISGHDVLRVPEWVGVAVNSYYSLGGEEHLGMNLTQYLNTICE
jgi:hypothetical protein